MEQGKRDFDAAAASWDREPARVKLAQDVAAAVRSEISLAPDMDVLDFGCGTGLLALELRPSVRSVTGADSSAGMIAVLNEKIRSRGLSGVSARLVDIGRGDLLEGSYQLVVSSMTLHHVEDVPALLARLYRSVSPGGSIAVADLDPDNGRFHPDGAGGFHQGFERKVLAAALRDAGFEDIRERTAAHVAKPAADGRMREFTVFLMTGKKSRT